VSTRKDVIIARIAALLADLTEPSERLTEPETILAELPGWDSIRFIEAIALTEEAFEIEIPMPELERIERIADLLRIVSTLTR
jgi:acyl carrier protein